MAATNPWFTIGVINGNGSSGSSSSGGMQNFLQSLSGTMAPMVNGSSGGAPQTYAYKLATQPDPAAAPASGSAPEQNPLFPTKKSKTDKNYKDPRMKSPSWMGGANLFDDDSHGANVMGQIAGRAASPAPTPTPTPTPGGSGSGGHGSGHHSGHGGRGGGYGGHLGPIGRAIAGRFGRWW